MLVVARVGVRRGHAMAACLAARGLTPGTPRVSSGLREQASQLADHMRIETGHAESRLGPHDQLVRLELVAGIWVDLNFKRPAPVDVHAASVQDQRCALRNAGGAVCGSPMSISFAVWFIPGSPTAVLRSKRPAAPHPSRFRANSRCYCRPLWRGIPRTGWSPGPLPAGTDRARRTPSRKP